MPFSTGYLISFQVLLLVVLFSNTLHNEFAFDDMYAIVRNEDANVDSEWSSMWFNDFWGQQISSEYSHKSYRPITVLSFRLNSYFHYLMKGINWYDNFCVTTMTSNHNLPPVEPRLRAEFFHVVNIILHGLVTLILGHFLKKLEKLQNNKNNIVPLVFDYFPLWFAISTMYLIHPIHVEAITGIVGRSELLCGLWMLIGLNYYLTLLNNYTIMSTFRISLQYILCISSFILAVLSKETGFALPVLYVTMEIIWQAETNLELIFFWRTKRRKLFFYNMILWITSCTTYLIFRRFITVHINILINRQLENPIAFITDFWSRTASSMYIHWRYFLLLLNPSQLSADYSLNCIPMIESPSDYRYLLPITLYFTIVILIFIGFYYFNMNNKYLNIIYLFGWLSMLITFFPASNVLIYVGTLIGERLLYVPSIGFCMIFGIIWYYFDNYLQKKKIIRIILFVAILCWYIWLCTLTYQRNLEWKSEETLFMSAQKVCNDSAKVQQNIGILERRYNNFEKALGHFDRATEIWPDFCEIDYWKGITLFNLNRMEEGKNYLMKGLHCPRVQSDSFQVIQMLFMNIKQEYPNNPEYTSFWAEALDLVDFKKEAGEAYVELMRSYLVQPFNELFTQYLMKAYNLIEIIEESKLEYLSDVTKCKYYYLKGNTLGYLDPTNPLESASNFLKSLDCEEFRMEALKSILKLQKENTDNPYLHEIWANAIWEMDSAQAIAHLRVALSLLEANEDNLEALSRMSKQLLSLLELHPEIRNTIENTEYQKIKYLSKK